MFVAPPVPVPVPVRRLEHGGSFLFRIVQHSRDSGQPGILGIGLVLGITPKQLHDILHAQFADGLATFDSGLSKLTLLFLEGQDPLFDGVGDGDLVDDDVDGLVKPVDAVDGLLFDELCRLWSAIDAVGKSMSWRCRKPYWIPKGLENDDTTGGSKIET